MSTSIFDGNEFAPLREAWLAYAQHMNIALQRKFPAPVSPEWEPEKKRLEATVVALWETAPVSKRERDLVDAGIGEGQETCCCCNEPATLLESASAWCAATWGGL